MNVGSYHQQHQQLLQFNIHQHQPSLPLGSNEADNKVNNRSDPMYNQEAPSMMGTPGHPGMPSMPPSMDQITRNVNKMSFQDNPAHNHASFPPQTMDQNKNMTPNDGLNGANNYGDFPSNNVRKMPPPSNSMPASISNNYHWNQGTNTNSYPNNNAAINNSPRSHDPNEGHTMQDQRAAPQQHNFSVPLQNKPATPASASQTNNFLPPQNKPAPPASAPQTNNFPLPSQNKSFPPAGASVSQTNNFPLPPQSSSVPPNNLPLSQNSSLSSAPPSSTPPSNNYALPPQNKSFPAASSGQQMNDFASPTQNKSFSPSPAVSQQDFISPSQNKPFPPVSQNNSYPAPQNSYPGQPQTFVSQNGSFPPSTQGSFSAPKPQGTFPPSVSGSYPTPRVNSPQHSFPPQGASYQNPSYPAASQPYPAAPSSAYPPSAAYRQPPKSQMYPSANPPPSSFSQYNQKSAFSPPPSRSAPGNLDQGNMMPQQPMGPPTHGYGDYQQQPQHKLDPDQMPNPIQVMIEDREVHKSETFITNQPGLMPPLVTTNFIVEDEGNANPRFIRSTMYNIPVNTDMMKQADVPFSLVITPLATLPAEEQLPPIVNTADFGPVRCVRCKAYVNPYMKFVDGGRRFVCALCKAVTEVPAEYFQHLDHTGNRVDRYERPELLYGAYEFTVTKEYCKDNEIPNVPAIIFVIDVSYNNVKSGMVKILCEQMSDIVQNYMPTDDHDENAPRMRVGFITYDSTVHFYNIKACLGQPQMMIVGDMDDVFVPLVEGFLCDPVESSSVIESLMEQIPVTFAETRETDTVLLPAIKAGVEALKAAKCAGKLLVFHSSLPTANVPGKLVNREDRKLLGTDKEKVQLSPQNSAYSSLAEECVNVGCSVDLFVFNNAPIDLPTIGQISKLTGGEIYKYTYFQAEIDGERLIEDVKRDTSRNIAFDAVMRVRTSTGIRPVNFFGHIFMKNTTDLELASINADKSVAVEIKHDDKLVEEEGAFVQVALLYTSCGGQRRVRILNLALKCCSQISDVFRSCELDTIINYLSKAAVTKIVEGTPRQVKEGLVNKCAHILACYRRLCASPSSPGQLILPECMKLLPLYMNCLLKSDAISGGSDMTVDDRWYMMQYVMIMDIPSSVNYFYPRLMPLVNIDYYSHELPFPIRCSSYKLTHSEAYLLENGVYMFLWLGSQVPAEWLMNVFGVVDPSLVALNVAKIPVLDNVHSKKINSIINQIQRERRHTMKLTIVRENDKMEIVFKHFLVEDGTGGAVMADNLSSSSYVDFLCHMHKEIRNMLS